jgi:hypothetical protein
MATCRLARAMSAFGNGENPPQWLIWAQSGRRLTLWDLRKAERSLDSPGLSRSVSAGAVDLATMVED